jgi:ankyrin repeat protein
MTEDYKDPLESWGRDPQLLLQRDSDGRVALHRMCLEFSEDLIGLLEYMVDICPESVFIADVEGYLPAHMAAQNGSLAAFAYLANFNPHCVYAQAKNGRTALHFAAQNSKLSVIKCILSLFPHTAAIPCNEGRLPLHLACVHGCILCVEALGESFPAAASIRTNEGRYTPLRVATEFKHLATVQYLYGLYPNAALETDSAGMTPLLVALNSRLVEISRLLIHLNPSAAVICHLATGQSPLHMACFLDDKILLRAMAAAAPNAVSAQDFDGFTPLHVCAQNNLFEHFRFLHDLDARPLTTLSHQSRSVLHLAAQHGNDAIVDFILQREKMLCKTASDDGQFLPLHSAAYHGHRQTMLMLLAACPSTVSCRNANGWMPVHSYMFGCRLLNYEMLETFFRLCPASIHAWGDVPSCTEIYLNKLKLSCSSSRDLAETALPTLGIMKSALSDSFLRTLRMLISYSGDHTSPLCGDVQWMFRLNAVWLSVRRRDCLEKVYDGSFESQLKHYVGGQILCRLAISAVDLWKYCIMYL